MNSGSFRIAVSSGVKSDRPLGIANDACCSLPASFLKLVQSHALLFQKFAHQGANVGALFCSKLDRVGDAFEIPVKDFLTEVPNTMALNHFFVGDRIISSMARHLRWRKDRMDPVKHGLRQFLEVSVFDVVVHGDKVIDVYFQLGD